MTQTMGQVTRLGLFCLVLSALTIALGCRSHGYPESRAEHQLDQERATVKRLSATIGRVRFDNEPLGRALRQTLDAAGVRVAIDVPAIEAAGVSMRLPVRLQLQRVTVEQTLRAILREAQINTSPREPLDYDVVGGQVMISTASNLARSTRYSNTYDIRAMLVNLSDYEDLPGYGINAQKSGKRDAQDERSFSRRVAMLARPAGSERQRRVEQIKQIITTTIGEPADWSPTHPAPSSVHEINGDLVVTTLPRNHRQVDQLLRDLHRSRRNARETMDK